MKTISEWSGWTRGTFGALARPDLVWLETIKKRFGENYKYTVPVTTRKRKTRKL